MEKMAQRGVDAALRLRTWLLNQQVVTSTVLPRVPRRVRWALREAYFRPVDYLERRTGRDHNGLVPPDSRNFTGSAGDFRQGGEALVRRLTALGLLTPSSRVLDIGCGLGRLAVPLTSVLADEGSYDGLDIVASGIEWCKENIEPLNPSFHFALADIYNSEYNQSGRLKASEYVFPYEDATFDLVVLVSVFTHMLPEDVEHYLAEIARVTRPGGSSYATFYLINGSSLELMEAGKGSLRFKYDFGPYWLVSPKVSPELSVGYDESYVRQLYAGCGLELTDDSPLLGGWCGRPGLGWQASALGDQDVVVATRA